MRRQHCTVHSPAVPRPSIGGSDAGGSWVSGKTQFIPRWSPELQGRQAPSFWLLGTTSCNARDKRPTEVGMWAWQDANPPNHPHTGGTCCQWEHRVRRAQGQNLQVLPRLSTLNSPPTGSHVFVDTCGALHPLTGHDGWWKEAGGVRRGRYSTAQPTARSMRMALPQSCSDQHGNKPDPTISLEPASHREHL